MSRLTALMAVAGLLLAPAAWADVPDKQAQTKGEVKVIRGPGGKKVYVLPETVLRVKIPRPSAFYVLDRTSLNTGLTPLERGFLPKILESVKKKPF